MLSLMETLYQTKLCFTCVQTERLSEGHGRLTPGDMVRLNAIQRSASMPTSILPYCRDTNTADTAARARVVVATCSTAGFLHRLGLGVGHFSHVIVDEAGQATEPECLLPLAMLAQSTTGQVGGVVSRMWAWLSKVGVSSKM